MTACSLKPNSVVDVLHGTAVRDPYRWLEDSSSPDTREWIHNQQRKSEDYFANCNDLNAMRERVRNYLDVSVFDQPMKVGSQYFYRRRDTGQEQACLYVRDGYAGAERLLVDPSKWGRYASVGIHRIAEDGSLLAFEVRQGGEDQVSMHFLKVETGENLSDQIATSEIRGLILLPENRGFVYCQEQAAAKEHVIVLHLFHGSTEEIIFRVKCHLGTSLTLIGDTVRLGALYQHHEDKQVVADFFVAQIEEPRTWTHLVADEGLPFCPALKSGRIFALTYEGSVNGRFVELNEEGDEVSTLVAEQERCIRQLVIGGGLVFITYLHDRSTFLRGWSLLGDLNDEVTITIKGTIRLLANPGYRDSNLFYTSESFDEPVTTFEYTPEGTSRLWHQPLIPKVRKSPIRYVSYASTDGTEIAMSLVGLHPPNESGAAGPVLMTAYGGFGVSMTPQFSPLISIMIELGAVFAFPHIRGGRDLGRAWHDAAKCHHRQSAFDDFLAGAEWLLANHLTTTRQLAIFGGSNAGLLVGVAMTQRPELFQAVLCVAPLLDMVRYERFGSCARWRPEFGTVDLAEDFEALYAYSPYHRIEENVDYPAVLFVSGDKDERCHPSHVRKTAAYLQGRAAQTHAVLVDYSAERGHTPSLPLSVRIDSLSRRIAFFCKELGIQVPEREN